ncbi:sugar-binding domain-containing protein, partial [Mesorhizobium sp.]
PIRICAAGGARKMGAIRAGLGGGYATHFVTDMATANILLE